MFCVLLVLHSLKIPLHFCTTAFFFVSSYEICPPSQYLFQYLFPYFQVNIKAEMEKLVCQ